MPNFIVNMTVVVKKEPGTRQEDAKKEENRQKKQHLTGLGVS